MLIIKKPKLHINIFKIKLFMFKYLEIYFEPTVTYSRYFRSVLVQMINMYSQLHYSFIPKFRTHTPREKIINNYANTF